MKMIVVGAALLLAALGVCGYGVWNFVSHLGESNRQFLAPGSYSFALDPAQGQSQSVKLWLDHKTVFQNKVYSGVSGHGAQIELRNEKGAQVDFPASSMSETMTIGGTSRGVIARTELSPGRYTVAISGLRQPAVFSVSVGDSFAGMFLGFFVSLVLSISAGVAGLLLVIFGIVRMVRQRRQAAAQTAAQQS